MKQADIDTPAPDQLQPGASDWFECMRRGDFASAWRISEALLAQRRGMPCWHLPRHLQYVWDGTPIAGRSVLVHCYHGLGDTVQFIRYAPLVREQAAELNVWAQPKLIPLLEHVRGIDRLLPLHDGAPDITCDVDVEVMELPFVFRSTLETLPASVPYIHLEPVNAPQGQALRVGLVWRSGDWDERRSVDFERIATLAPLPGIEWHVLQHGPDRERWEREIGPVPRHPSLLDEARAMRALDLVISVDSMPAHLAGALGVPVWTLLPSEADWRWMRDRDDSPWYPTMRLFRQQRMGEWQPVIAEVSRALQQLVKARSAGQGALRSVRRSLSRRQPGRAPHPKVERYREGHDQCGDG